MRDIKFRAWHEDHKTMVNFDPETLVKDEYQALALVTLMKNKSKYLMQYTGLKDKNGKEIYGGDIVSSDSGNWNHGEVIFRNALF